MAQMQRHADLNRRGAIAMGFDQEQVAYHFRLTARGGDIQVDVKSSSDDVNRQAIRTHLQGIAVAFADGHCDAPLCTHAQVPPGVAELQRLKSTVTYTVSETPDGGIVRIAIPNADAIEAIHAFCRIKSRNITPAIRSRSGSDPL